MPPNCLQAGGPIFTACGNDLQAGQSQGNAQNATSAQVAAFVESHGLAKPCCDALAALIDAGCVCNEAAKQLVQQTGSQALFEGLTIAFPTVCGRPGAACALPPAPEPEMMH